MQTDPTHTSIALEGISLEFNWSVSMSEPLEYRRKSSKFSRSIAFPRAPLADFAPYSIVVIYSFERNTCYLHVQIKKHTKFEKVLSGNVKSNFKNQVILTLKNLGNLG